VLDLPIILSMLTTMISKFASDVGHDPKMVMATWLMQTAITILSMQITIMAMTGIQTNRTTHEVIIDMALALMLMRDCHGNSIEVNT